MPTSFVRLIVAGLTLVLAVLTGLVTGFVAGGPGCDSSQTPASTVSTGPATGPSTGPATVAPNSGGGPVGASPTSDSPDKPDVDIPGPNGATEGNTLPGGNAFTLSADGCNSGFSALTAVFGFLGALLTGGIIAGIALFVPRADTPRPVPSGGYHPVTPPAPARGVSSSTGAHAVLTDVGTAAPESGRLTRERKTLVDTCIYVRDRATSKAIADRLAWALNEVGVVEDRPAGEPFDTARHEAGGTTPTGDRALAGTIAAVEIAGYTDRGQIVRAPVVTVYQAENR